jgi:hypothetical protein
MEGIKSRQLRELRIVHTELYVVCAEHLSNSALWKSDADGASGEQPLSA